MLGLKEFADEYGGGVGAVSLGPEKKCSDGGVTCFGCAKNF